jgi:hypothetical protein
MELHFSRLLEAIIPVLSSIDTGYGNNGGRRVLLMDHLANELLDSREKCLL